MGTILDGYPWWSQLTDPDPRTGRPDVFAATDCGEEVVSIWLAGRRKLYTDAADLRRQLPGERVDGRTTGADLAYLLGQHGEPAVAAQMHPTALKAAVHDAVALLEPLALLGYWLTSNQLHWILGTGFGNDALILMEPWAGRLTAYRWSVVYSLATGTVVQRQP